jgi:hypothetical protein
MQDRDKARQAIGQGPDLRLKTKSKTKKTKDQQGLNQDGDNERPKEYILSGLEN